MLAQSTIDFYKNRKQRQALQSSGSIWVNPYDLGPAANWQVRRNVARRLRHHVQRGFTVEEVKTASVAAVLSSSSSRIMCKSSDSMGCRDVVTTLTDDILAAEELTEPSHAKIAEKQLQRPSAQRLPPLDSHAWLSSQLALVHIPTTFSRASVPVHVCYNLVHMRAGDVQRAWCLLVAALAATLIRPKPGQRPAPPDKLDQLRRQPSPWSRPAAGSERWAVTVSGAPADTMLARAVHPEREPI